MTEKLKQQRRKAQQKWYYNMMNDPDLHQLYLEQKRRRYKINNRNKIKQQWNS